MSNWATRTKGALNTTPINDGLENLSGGDREPIVAFYRYTEPKKANPLARVLTKGSKIEGTYEGSFTIKSKNPKFNDQKLYKVRTEEGLVAVADSSGISRGMKNAKEGGRVVIVYSGKNAAGFHDFTVRGERA